VPRPQARHVLHAVALVVGLVGLAVLIDQLGWSEIEQAIVSAGPWFAVLALIDLASVFCDAGGIHTFVRPLAKVSYFRVFCAQASGLAINRLTPGNSLGEPIKVTMLMQDIPEAAAVAGIVMYNLAAYLFAISIIVIGVPLTLLSMDLPTEIQIGVSILAGLLILVMVGLVTLVRRGALATAIHAIRRLRIISPERAARWETRIAAIDTNVKRFGDATTRRAFAFAVLGRSLNSLGTVLVLVAAGIPLTWPLVIGMLSVGILIQWMSNVIPLGLGLADGGNYVLSGALGSAPGAGLAFTMVNRVRTVVLATMGLAVMALANLTERGRSSPDRPRP
jgi:uncharacterized protein (TIRG00374 family)